MRQIAKGQPDAMILREKDLSEAEYRELAKQVIAICREEQVLCVLHSFIDTARKLGHPAIHLPMKLLRGLSGKERQEFPVLGASCHSLEEALEAQELGCTYLTAGHIFQTDCKKGMPGRGIGFLREICEHVEIPVYAIGGIDDGKIGMIREAKASGVCLMSSLMEAKNPRQYLRILKGEEG